MAIEDDGEVAESLDRGRGRCDPAEADGQSGDRDGRVEVEPRRVGQPETLDKRDES